MTSSLVGSEMCIRDRRSSFPGGQQQVVPNEWKDTLDVHQKQHLTKCLHCLLYTSDAADDM
eukprot:4777659-Prorocentrum_lima.AAC.1